MVAHAEATYPNECCGALLGTVDGEARWVREARPLTNAYRGSQKDRYEILPEELLAVERQARQAGLQLLGIYHSHPDCDAYFSRTDLENSCPWYWFVVLSVRQGRVERAACFVPNAEQTAAAEQPLVVPQGAVC